eukprot:CAMPEP_0184018476 /NCGR_PEP_ID=MMETSP0954-20121128/8170_1 /TAXON_ID=627963 /ORGANISM="Aplanochytrium sp, Strain PBS07" /LENGTH=248 /DNA_ID=CAMNT_0026299941 /DNA_START=283 /DNA_END=1026 /DNA_ORIENTATION=-
MSLHFGIINKKFMSISEKESVLMRNISTIRSSLLQVGLIQLTRLNLASASLKECIWQSLFDMSELALNMVKVYEVDDSKKMDENDILLLHVQLDDLKPKLQRILELTPVEQASASINVLDSKRLTETSMAVSHAFMWMVNFVRSWAAIMPKRKKKKKKQAQLDDSVVNQQTIEQDVVTVTSILYKTFKVMNDHFSAMRPALASPEACDPFISNILEENEKHLKDLIPEDVARKSVSLVLISYEKSFLN